MTFIEKLKCVAFLPILAIPFIWMLAILILILPVKSKILK